MTRKSLQELQREACAEAFREKADKMRQFISPLPAVIEAINVLFNAVSKTPLVVPETLSQAQYHPEGRWVMSFDSNSEYCTVFYKTPDDEHTPLLKDAPYSTAAKVWESLTKQHTDIIWLQTALYAQKSLVEGCRENRAAGRDYCGACADCVTRWKSQAEERAGLIDTLQSQLAQEKKRLADMPVTSLDKVRASLKKAIAYGEVLRHGLEELAGTFMPDPLEPQDEVAMKARNILAEAHEKLTET